MRAFAADNCTVREAQARAAALAERFPEAREALEFCAALLAFDGDLTELRELVRKKGSLLIRRAAATVTDDEVAEASAQCRRGEHPESTAGFFARVLLRLRPPRLVGVHDNRCPECGWPPQCGCVHWHTADRAMRLVCSLCAAQWDFPRDQCPSCGEVAVIYASQRMRHVSTQTCEKCSTYLHIIDVGQDPAAIPLVDEVAALFLDVWALETGLRKVHPNLIGV